MTTSTDEVTIAAPFVPRFRNGLKRELGAIVDILRVELDVELTPERWKTALASFTDGCELLEVVGLTDDPPQPDLALDVRRWPQLVLKVLEAEYHDGLRRIRDAEADGFDPKMIARHVPAFGALVKEVQQRTGIKPKRGRQMSFLEAQLAERRKGRRRGDGQ